MKTRQNLTEHHMSVVYRMSLETNPRVPWQRWYRLLSLRNALAVRVLGMDRLERMRGAE